MDHPHGRDEELAKLREAVRVREALLSAAAHELMSPMNSLRLKVELTRNQLEAGRSESAAARLRDCEQELDGLVLRLRTLLDTSQVLAGQFQVAREEVDLAALVRQTAGALEARAVLARSPLHVEAEEPTRGAWDANRLEQLCVHLLSHALQHGAGSPLRLAVRRQEEWALLQLSGEGVGMAQERLSRIFEGFEQAVTPEEPGGFGLGLWMSRQIALALHGELEARSGPGRGWELTVRLPLAPLARPERQE